MPSKHFFPPQLLSHQLEEPLEYWPVGPTKSIKTSQGNKGTSFVNIIEKLPPIITGILLIVFGILVLKVPRFYDQIYGQYFDFSNYNMPFGFLCGFVGILFILSSVKKRGKKK